MLSTTLRNKGLVKCNALIDSDKYTFLSWLQPSTYSKIYCFTYSELKCLHSEMVINFHVAITTKRHKNTRP